jgi:hypothetical protein
MFKEDDRLQAFTPIPCTCLLSFISAVAIGVPSTPARAVAPADRSWRAHPRGLSGRLLSTAASVGANRISCG